LSHVKANTDKPNWFQIIIMLNHKKRALIFNVLLMSAVTGALNSCGGDDLLSASDPFWNAFNSPTPSDVPAVTSELPNPFN